MLADQGLKRGDRALIYMPMIPETVAAMLAVGRLGAVHSVVFGGKSPFYFFYSGHRLLNPGKINLLVIPNFP